MDSAARAPASGAAWQPPARQAAPPRCAARAGPCGPPAAAEPPGASSARRAHGDAPGPAQACRGAQEPEQGQTICRCRRGGRRDVLRVLGGGRMIPAEYTPHLSLASAAPGAAMTASLWHLRGSQERRRERRIRSAIGSHVSDPADMLENIYNRAEKAEQATGRPKRHARTLPSTCAAQRRRGSASKDTCPS